VNTARKDERADARSPSQGGSIGTRSSAGRQAKNGCAAAFILKSACGHLRGHGVVNASIRPSSMVLQRWGPRFSEVTNSRESTLICESSACVEGGRLQVQTHSPCEIHRRQCQIAQVGEVGELLLDPPWKSNRGNTGGRSHSKDRGGGEREDTRKQREEARPFGPGPGRVQQPGLRAGRRGREEESRGRGRGTLPGRTEGGGVGRHSRIRGAAGRSAGRGGRIGPWGRTRCSPVHPLARQET
jgi:hypothetical protein